MDEAERARIRVFLNDPEGRGDRLVSIEAPQETARGPWGFRIEGKAPEPRAYEPDTSPFLYWQLASALERGKRLWSERLPGPGRWIPGPVLPALPAEGKDLNAFYDRQALHFFRDTDAKTHAIVQSGDSPDIVTHEQGHAVLDAIRPDLWDAPYFEAAAFHEAFGDLAAIFVALATPALVETVDAATKSDPSRSNLVSRLAEELGAAVRDNYGADAALPGALRDAVNTFSYANPKTLPDTAPARALSAEPHSFCRVMTGACWDVLVTVFRATEGADRAAALASAAKTTARLAVAAAETAPLGADFFGRVSRRIVREARAAGDAPADRLAEDLFRRRLLASPVVPDELHPDEDPGVTAPEAGEPMSPGLVRAIEKRLGSASRGEIVTLAREAAPARTGARILRGRRRRDLVLHGREYGPADGAAVEISDSFALGFTPEGLLRASLVHPAADPDEEDARAFVRFLARQRRIAAAGDDSPDPERLARERKSHVVVREADGTRRLRRAWIAAKGES